MVVFLDAHCEVNVNWLPPLLARIAHNRTIIPVPFVVSIQWDTFQYSAQYQGESFRGIWEWSLFYKESRVVRIGTCTLQ